MSNVMSPQEIRDSFAQRDREELEQRVNAIIERCMGTAKASHGVLGFPRRMTIDVTKDLDATGGREAVDGAVKALLAKGWAAKHEPGIQPDGEAPYVIRFGERTD